ncbi:kinesin light chain, putative [Talaromyces stipitatus ATCC 10500]|uniref:Kinesin light chain, putative n=1 Tax=Talaromyces stipitatus (strain ATCC 10500 / CBS 375.48 / QM 6759 / NRRL 1006) TaxID=441959 RepID=B8MBJ2_TALSN|nr:kinesin light chain, putative [Talaromyces stipitatus ATCC 10500]EED17856.1 kinesin light chain, putative [Talaromyces stipitatus ATCC 10500]
MRPKTRKDFAIALPLEADAVEALFDEQYDRLGKYYGKQPGGANAYINGRIGKHDVVLCYIPGMGKGNAAGVAASLKVSYPGVELALVVGICGGAPPPPKYQEIFLGDVIISNFVVKYDFGRQYLGGRKICALLNGLRAENARRELQDQTQQYLRILQQRGAKWYRPNADDILFNASYPHKHYSHASTGCSCFGSDSPDNICEAALRQSCNELECNKGQAIRYREPSEAVQTSLYIGTVASADTVMKSGQHRDEIVRKENAIGFEMEGAGVWDHVSCIIIKGVCDYADSHKNKLWQAYAAATGASAAKAFLDYWPVDHEDASKTRHLMTPFERNDCFVGRHDEIQKLEDLISVPDRAKRLAITGLGGVGKTQVALELAYRMRDREPECSIFWIPCTSSEAVEQACMTIAEMVGLQDVKPAEIKERIKTYFSQNDEKWLLIFDNADDIDMWVNGNNDTLPLKNFLPVNNHGHVIFTTRNRELAVDLASPYVIHVRELDEKTGMEFLEKSLVRTDLLHDSRTTIALLEQLTFLPLAISQATAYINKKDIMLSDYLILLEEQEADVVELLSKDFGDNGRYNDIQSPIAKTWLISFSQVQKLDQLAAEYLSLMACVNPRNIPQAFLPQPGSKLKMRDALGLLSAYSFITIQPGNSSISLHRLVHLATRNWMRKEEQFSVYITKAADRLNEIFPHNDHTNRQLWREYLPHTLSLLSEREFREQQQQYIDYIQKVGACLYSDGRNNEAEKLLAQVMMDRKQVLGPEHPVTLASMNNLSLTYLNQGRWKEAEALQVQVMETWKQALGPEHPSTLTSMSNLSVTYQNQGRWKEAEELGVQATETRKQVLGPEHPDTLTSMCNLAYTWKSLGNIQAAFALMEECFELRIKALGPDHPDTTSSSHILSSWNAADSGSWRFGRIWLISVVVIPLLALAITGIQRLC